MYLRLRRVNAYLKWTGSDLKIPRLREEKILKTLTSEDVKRLLSHKTKSKSQSRASSLAILLLDTGLRIAEALSLRSSDVDLDNFHIKVQGKGRKERLIPFFIAGRRVLYHLTRGKAGYLFPTPGGTLSTRDACEISPSCVSRLALAGSVAVPTLYATPSRSPTYGMEAT
jgi:integrase